MTGPNLKHHMHAQMQPPHHLPSLQHGVIAYTPTKDRVRSLPNNLTVIPPPNATTNLPLKSSSSAHALASTTSGSTGVAFSSTTYTHHPPMSPIHSHQSHQLHHNNSSHSLTHATPPGKKQISTVPLQMTLEVLEQGFTQKRIKGEPIETFLKRASHMSIVGKGVEMMENLSMCRNLSVLYLYDNKITRIAGLEACKNLTRLYLQNNQIEVLEGLDCGLDRLTDLHLSGNKLSLITGLHALPSLETLHVDHQKTNLPLEFDIMSMESLGNSLKHMTATSNRIKDLTPLTALRILQDIDLSNNDISEWDDLAMLNINMNPVNQNVLKLRQRSILASKSLECFNEKNIPPVEREFLYNMEMARKRAQRNPPAPPGSMAPFGRQDSFGPPNLTAMPSFNSIDRKVLNNLGGKVSFGGIEEPRPIPHLPPYATQYRDLMLHQVATVSKALDHRRAALRSGMRRAQVARAAEISLMPVEQKNSLDGDPNNFGGIAPSGPLSAQSMEAAFFASTGKSLADFFLQQRG
ncbi:hypothetical protein BC829DRAFT_414359 [Chytridium lagenaria]|nr:hypothetical protein BC829DRAFT_414359 [Chytridium lagenaria]